jgi:hypothetical protein
MDAYLHYLVTHTVVLVLRAIIATLAVVAYHVLMLDYLLALHNVENDDDLRLVQHLEVVLGSLLFLTV